MKYEVDFLKRLYGKMVEIRLCEESFVEPILRRDVFCPCHLYTGQEAVAAGVCAALKDKDYVFGNHRSHGHYLAKGGGLKELVSEIYCRESGCARGRGGSMHLIDPEKGMLGSAPIVCGTVSLALGAALASSIRGEDRVSVAFFGDGATGEGVLYESMNFAALRKLPIIFACENNLYATHMPIRDCRVSDDISLIAAPFCIEAVRVDGNNVLSVYEKSKKAVAKCRDGKGPIFMEFLTYRYRGHVGPDDNIQGSHTDIRPEKELAGWLKRDPITRFERWLIRNKLAGPDELGKIKKKIERAVQEAHALAKQSPLPDKKDLLQYVFK